MPLRRSLIGLGRNARFNGWKSSNERSPKCRENQRAGMVKPPGRVKARVLGILDWNLGEWLERMVQSRGKARAQVQWGKGKQFHEALGGNRPVLLALYSEDSLLRYQVWKRFHSKGEYTLEDLSREMRSRWEPAVSGILPILPQT